MLATRALVHREAGRVMQTPSRRDGRSSRSNIGRRSERPSREPNDRLDRRQSEKRRENNVIRPNRFDQVRRSEQIDGGFRAGRSRSPLRSFHEKHTVPHTKDVRLSARPGMSRRARRSGSSNTSRSHSRGNSGTRSRSKRRHSKPHSTRRSNYEFRRQSPYENNDNRLLKSLIEVIDRIKPSSHIERFPVLNNVIPEFDPMQKEQTISAWISKVEESRHIYEWSERQTIHYALPKLVGIAKTWYQGLPSVLYSWNEWKTKMLESFPETQNYAELLTEMLNKKVRFGESLELYYYAKINLLNRCKITGREAVDCLIYGIEDRGIRLGAQAARFTNSEQLLKFFKTVKIGTSKEDNKTGRDRDRRPIHNQISNALAKPPVSERGKITCFNCNEVGHVSFKCPKPIIKCTRCNRMGHMVNDCPRTQASQKLAHKEVNVMQVNNNDASAIYTFPIKINGTSILAHVDLGSDCTLIRQSDATAIGLIWNTLNLPSLRGLGNIPYQPEGRALVDINVKGVFEKNVEILIVDDGLINYPVLIGRTFTERPNITIVKTCNELAFSHCDIDEEIPNLWLFCDENITINNSEIATVPVKCSQEFSGRLYISDSTRNLGRTKYYLLPGEIGILKGKGHIVVQNLGNDSIQICRDSLITRKVYLSNGNDASVMNISYVKDDNFKPDVGGDLPEHQKQQLFNLLSKFKECFSFYLKDLGFSTVTEMVIQLKDTEPVVYRPYRLSHFERDEVRQMVAEMLECGIIRESTSPYASPIVVVKKKNGEKRLCVDYRSLNAKTKREHYPLPRVEDLLDELSGQAIFTSLDLASGYYQIPIAEGSRERTAFVTPDGQYEYTRMPFGLANAPSVFQRAMHKILGKARVNYVIIYMDDVLIPARSFEEGLTRLEEVLNLLKEGGFTLKLEKCKFMHKTIDFLGFEICADGVKPGAQKTNAVSRFPVPLDQRDVRRFLGLASFFRRFIRNFAVVAKPLTSLLKKDSTWVWGDSQKAAFNALKEQLTVRPILALYDRNLETQLHTDASKLGVAGILLQKHDEVWRVVSYYSRQTSTDEQKLHSFELETLAVIASLNRFRVYLLGVKFKILTDCHSLRTTLTKRDLIPRIARWWLQLQEFDCEFEYRPGEKMAHVDALSRGPIDINDEPVHVLDILNISSDDWIATVQSSDD